MWSQVTGGLANGYLQTNNTNPTLGSFAVLVLRGCPGCLTPLAKRMAAQSHGSVRAVRSARRTPRWQRAFHEYKLARQEARALRGALLP